MTVIYQGGEMSAGRLASGNLTRTTTPIQFRPNLLKPELIYQQAARQTAISRSYFDNAAKLRASPTFMQKHVTPAIEASPAFIKLFRIQERAATLSNTASDQRRRHRRNDASQLASRASSAQSEGVSAVQLPIGCFANVVDIGKPYPADQVGSRQ